MTLGIPNSGQTEIRVHERVPVENRLCCTRRPALRFLYLYYLIYLVLRTHTITHSIYVATRNFPIAFALRSPHLIPPSNRERSALTAPAPLFELPGRPQTRNEYEFANTVDVLAGARAFAHRGNGKGKATGTQGGLDEHATLQRAWRAYSGDPGFHVSSSRWKSGLKTWTRPLHQLPSPPLPDLLARSVM